MALWFLTLYGSYFQLSRSDFFIMIIIILNESQEFHINTGLWQLELAALPALHVSCLLRQGASEAWAVTAHVCRASSKTSPVSAGFLNFPRAAEKKQPFPRCFSEAVAGVTPEFGLH